ncbi:hypothetical protein [uncultured Ruminococcus sp.]|uniref:hypothetical protein n=1 Tax=uncultured Ruminococcus sp. TaxID=165186 RepID=UPI002943BF4B|nr:hypothetical protein [uncultured Ruminococcus sp.]
MQRKYQFGKPLCRQEQYWNLRVIYLSRTYRDSRSKTVAEELRLDRQNAIWLLLQQNDKEIV